MLQNFPSRGLPLSPDTFASAKTGQRFSSIQRPKRQKQTLGAGQSAGVRKLVITHGGSKVPPKAENSGEIADSNADFQGSLEQYFDSVWIALDNALGMIWANGQIQGSFEALYRGVENLCREGKAEELWDHLKVRMQKHIWDDFCKESLIPYAESLTQVENTFDSNTNEMAARVVDTWQLWGSQLTIVRNMFFYLDRSYLLQKTGEVSIWDAGLVYFRSVVVKYKSIELQLMASIMASFERYRSHDVEQRELIKRAIQMFIALDVYMSLFHPQFIASTREHYTVLADEKAETVSVKDYLELTQSSLAFELEQANIFSLRPATKSLAVEVVKKAMIESKVEILVSRGFTDLISSNDTISLGQMYELFSTVDQEKILLSSWSSYIRAEGMKLVMDPAKDSEMVNSLLTFKAQLDNIITTSFKSDDVFSHALRESFELFINKRQNVPAEMIAKYIDEILRAGNKKMEDSVLEVRMSEVLVLFRFIHGKDVFEAFYKRDLAKRLLLNRSASDDAERSMLTRLKTECGTEFTKKLEGMFQDTELSKDFMVSYKESKLSLESDSKIELYVNALSRAFWPTYPEVNLVMPQEMNLLLSNFEKFYQSKRSGRRITWAHSLGHCSVRATFPRGKKELSMSLFQTVVLLLFNELSDGEFLTYRQIQAATELEDKHLIRTLQSLACGKIRVLSKEPRGKDVNPDDKFGINLRFESRAFHLRINQIQLKETPEENKETHDQVQRDRQYEIQACIIRIMKTRKTIKHVELVTQTIDATKNRGTLDMSEIKKNIEKLIEKEYMERDGADTYVYLT
ncbi:Cullin family-domain-containing protein [Lipomyces oligophaga]|uniref:Cullin family-domain-containing protein n=1 Tax=Lipomyces oligophaga TaxID=45792 RepID=UPI0034CE909A